MLVKLSELESEKKENTEKLQGDIQKKEDEIDGFQKEILKTNQQVMSLEEQVNKLHSTVEEKEQLIIQYKDKEKQLETLKAEVSLIILLRFFLKIVSMTWDELRNHLKFFHRSRHS